MALKKILSFGTLLLSQKVYQAISEATSIKETEGSHVSCNIQRRKLVDDHLDVVLSSLLFSLNKTEVHSFSGLRPPDGSNIPSIDG